MSTVTPTPAGNEKRCPKPFKFGERRAPKAENVYAVVAVLAIVLFIVSFYIEMLERVARG